MIISESISSSGSMIVVRTPGTAAVSYTHLHQRLLVFGGHLDQLLVQLLGLFKLFGRNFQLLAAVSYTHLASASRVTSRCPWTGPCATPKTCPWW